MNSRRSVLSWRNALRGWLPVIGVLALLWGPLVYQLGAQWSAYEQYNYGWAVPCLCLYLIWQRWPNRPGNQPGPVSSKAIVLFGCLLLFLFPVRVLHEANPVWRLTSLAWMLIVVGLTSALVWRIGGVAWLRLFGPPVCFFLVAVPWPTPIETGVVQGLMRLNVGITVEVLQVIGIPALQKGNVVELATGLLGVEEACSGIRSLQATLMIGVFWGILYRLSLRRLAVLVLSSAALAFSFNVVRTSLLSWVAARQGVSSVAKWHDPAGVTILIACFLSLWLMALGLAAKKHKLLKEARMDPNAVEGDHEIPEIRERETGSETVNSNQTSAPRNLAFILLGWSLLVEGGTELWFRMHEGLGGFARWTVQWPRENASFQTVELSSQVLGALNCDLGESGRWREADGSCWQVYSLQWLPGRSVYQRVRVSLAKCHNPEVCLQAVGLALRSEMAPVTAQLSSGRPLTFRRYLFEAEGKPVHVFFSVMENMDTGQGTTALLRRSHWDRVKAALAGSRNYGQRTLEIAVWGIESPGEADAAFRRQLEKLIRVEGPGS